MSVGEEIRKKRLEVNLSQRALAAQLGMDHTSLAKYESGQRFPLSFIPVIADFLRISEYVLRERVMKEKFTEQVEGPYLPLEKIETLAERDRATVLKALGREQFLFPKDRDVIPRLLSGLQVLYEDTLFSEQVVTAERGQQIYAGLFVDDHSYHGTSGVIAVATDQVRRGRKTAASEKTLTFHVLHELGHHRLHRHEGKLDKLRSPRAPDKPLYCSSGARAHNRIEMQANSYAISFLLPRQELNRWLRDDLRFNLKKDGKTVCEEFFIEQQWLEWRLNRLGIKAY